MAIYFKCPHCGSPIMDFQDENLIDYDNLIYQCPECKSELTEDDMIECEDFVRLEQEHLKSREGVQEIIQAADK